MTEQIPVREGAFVKSPGGDVLVANKCQSCGQIFFPKASLCLTCTSEELEEMQLSGRGKLYAYTIGRMPSMHFKPPYAIGYVDMPEGIRIFAPLKITDDTPVHIGMDMEVVIEQLWQEEGKEVIGYKFMPV
ncbi:MAG: OB-fold domain-containing protein [Desulfatiglans sp.]|nr:OB-fold domain-containing protein [Thermodesulfobacteriota bacterium]MEE4353092.1 OB-fold domain-containing protein [Desulfatiglans sp.]